MSRSPSYQALEQKVKHLEKALASAQRAEATNAALFHIASALNNSASLQDFYHAVHRHLSSLMDMTNFFIAVYYKDKDAIQCVFQRDSHNSFSPKWIYNFIDTPSLTGEVILRQKPLLFDEQQLSEMAVKGYLMGQLPKNWLGVPLMVQNDILGVMAVQSYTNPAKYNQEHLDLLSFVSETIAVAIEKKWAEKELKRAREKLIRSQKFEAIGTLAGGMAHDINNTLSIILGNINLAQMAAGMDPVKKYLAEAELAVRQTKELASKFVVFSKGSGIIKSHFEVQGFLKDILEKLEQEKKILCRLEITDLPQMMEADENQLREALRNIIINAAEAGSETNVVQVIAGRHPEKSGMIKISVIDHGRGILEDHLEKIYNPYFSTKPMCNDKGTGLGLSIAWAIVKNHQGTITVESKPGHGTRVDITLPVYQKGIPKRQTSKVAAPAPIHRPRPRKFLVLFMDDNAMIRKVAKKILERLGYEPVIAKTGEEAVEKYQSCLVAGKIIEKAILDLEVKRGMGGVETMEKLLALNPGIEGIVASGYSEDPAMKSYANFGFSAALSKPFSIDALKKALQ